MAIKWPKKRAQLAIVTQHLHASGGRGLRGITLCTSIEESFQHLSSALPAAPSLEEMHLFELGPVENMTPLCTWLVAQEARLHVLSCQTNMPVHVHVKIGTLANFGLLSIKESPDVPDWSRLAHLLLGGINCQENKFFVQPLSLSGGNNLVQIVLFDVLVTKAQFLGLMGGAATS